MEGAIQRYVQIRNSDDMRMSELSEIYDYIRDGKHEIESATNALKLLYTSPHHLDIMFVSKKLF